MQSSNIYEADLCDVDTEELLVELTRRKVIFGEESVALLDKIFNLRRLNLDYQSELDNLIYAVLGRIQ